MLLDVLNWMVIGSFVAGGVCLLAMAVPFRPFGSRRRAAQCLLLTSGALLATSVSMAAMAPPVAGRQPERVVAEAAVAGGETVKDTSEDMTSAAAGDETGDETDGAAHSDGLVTLLAALTPRREVRTDATPEAVSLPSDEPVAPAAPAVEALVAAVRGALGPITEGGPELRFPDAGFSWGDATRPYRAEIVEIVNRIAIQHARCPDPNPASVTRSADGTGEDPVFLVTCGRGHEAFRLRFRPGDAAAGRVFAAVRALDGPAAVAACAEVAQARGVPPVRFSEEPALTYVNERSGLARIQSSFAAGEGRAFDIHCLFEGPALIEAAIQERAG